MEQSKDGLPATRMTTTKTFKKRFEEFCSNLEIESKESGLIPLRWNNCQRIMIDKICDGLDRGIRFFVVLKGRQLGITTVSLALDLFWHWENDGCQGTIIVNSTDNVDYVRSLLKNYISNIPSDYRLGVERDNQYEMLFANRSRISYQNAGVARAGGSKLGRGKAIAFVHSTETAFYKDDDGMDSLLGVLAEHNPIRLYLFESTANGFNRFEDMWVTAKDSVTQEAIFLAWWMHEEYSIPDDDPRYEIYYSSCKHLDSDEKEWVAAVHKTYGYDISPNQIAWYRWKLHEHVKDPLMMMQEFPPTEEHAFVVTGHRYFSNKLLALARKNKVKEKHFRYIFGDNFYDTRTQQSSREHGNLTIWEDPNPRGQYVVGVHPAFSIDRKSPYNSISVYRCYADRMIQVAEYYAQLANTYELAWVALHLGGYYRNTTINLEIGGNGMGVHQEMLDAINLVPRGGNYSSDIGDFLAQVRFYLYGRIDSVSGNRGAYHFQTTFQTRSLAMSAAKDLFDRGKLIIRSQELIGEMRGMVNDGGDVGSSANGLEDRVNAMSLAVIAYVQQLRPDLHNRGITKDNEDKIESRSPAQNVLQRTIWQIMAPLRAGQ